MSSENLKEYGAHAVSIAVIGYAALPSTAHDLWFVGGAAVLSLTLEIIRRVWPITPPEVPTSEPLEAAKSIVDRGMATVESLAENVLRLPQSSLPVSIVDPEDDDGDQHVKWQTWGWLAGISQILAMFMSSYQNPIALPDLIELLRRAQQQELAKASIHPSGSKEHAFHKAVSFAWGHVAATIDPAAPPETGP